MSVAQVNLNSTDILRNELKLIRGHKPKPGSHGIRHMWGIKWMTTVTESSGLDLMTKLKSNRLLTPWSLLRAEQLLSPSLDSPVPWVNSSWYCLLGKEAGKTLDIRGLGDKKEQKVNLRSMNCHNTYTWVSLPHSVRQSQDPQDKEVDGQQQVDVLLRKHLHQNKSNWV